MAAARATQTRARPNTRRTAAPKKRPPTRGGSVSRRKPAASSKKRRRSTRPQVVTLLLVGTIVVSAWMVYPVLRLQYQHEREVQSLESELTGLRERNDVLREQVDALKTPEGVEELARENLGFVKPGEQAYVVTGGSTETSTGPMTHDVLPETPLWQRVLDALFGFD